jgi:hypothetical protein
VNDIVTHSDATWLAINANTGSLPSGANPDWQLLGGSGSGSLAGDVAGAPNATVVGRIQGRDVSSVAPVANQVLAWTSAS